MNYKNKKSNTDFRQITLPLLNNADIHNIEFWLEVREETKVFKMIQKGEEDDSFEEFIGFRRA